MFDVNCLDIYVVMIDWSEDWAADEWSGSVSVSTHYFIDCLCHVVLVLLCCYNIVKGVSSGKLCATWDQGISPLDHSLHLLLFFTFPFFLFSFALPIFFFCPSLSFLPE